jgi:hypothetical protein
VNQPEFGRDRFAWSWRAVLVAAGMLLLALLVTARMLTPDPRGFGTHQKLGLSPCTMQTVFRVRCPACGMTTSWAHLVRGDVVSSFRANSGGALLALTSMVIGPWFLVTGLRGCWIVEPPGEGWVVAYALLLVGVIMGEWILRQFVFL